MISFRFHIVSLTAVFLALAIGIGVGAAVVDRATVDAIQDQLDNVRHRADSTNRANDELRGELALWQRFADEGARQLVAGHLADVPVSLIAFEGIDREPVERLAELVAAAGARYQGTLWVTSRFQLDNPEHQQALRDVVGATAGRADALQRAAATAMAEAWVGQREGLLPALRDAAFLDYEPPTAEGFDLATIPTAETYVLVVSGAGSVVPSEQLAISFVSVLSQLRPLSVIAAEGAPPEGEEPDFVPALRGDAEASARVATVDNVEDVRGRLAAVLAVEALTAGRTGHYGVGDGARALVPQPAP